MQGVIGSVYNKELGKKGIPEIHREYQSTQHRLGCSIFSCKFVLHFRIKGWGDLCTSELKISWRTQIFFKNGGGREHLGSQPSLCLNHMAKFFNFFYLQHLFFSIIQNK